MESWRTMWRHAVTALPGVCLRTAGAASGTAVEYKKAALGGLLEALRGDSPALVQGSTTTPPPLMCVQDWPVEAADPLGTLGLWSGAIPLKPDATAHSVGQVGEFFAAMCFEIDQLAGDPASCRWLLNWWDETPRDEARALLIPEVEFALDPACGDPFVCGARAKLSKPAAEPCPF